MQAAGVGATPLVAVAVGATAVGVTSGTVAVAVGFDDGTPPKQTANEMPAIV
jgi:hypothetical protein